MHPVGNTSTSCYQTAESITTEQSATPPRLRPNVSVWVRVCVCVCVSGWTELCLNGCLCEYTFMCLWLCVFVCVCVYLCDENTLSYLFPVHACLWRGEEVYVCVCVCVSLKVRESERERERERGEAWPTFGKAHRMSMKLPNITPELLSTEPPDWLLSAPAWQQHWHHPGGGGGERESERGGHGEEVHTLNPKEEKM